MTPPEDMEDAAALLPTIAEALLARLAAGRDTPANLDAPGLAARMGASGWAWAPYVLAALGGGGKPTDGLRVWKRLPEWEEEAPPPPPSSHPVPPADARRSLAAILGAGAEQRPGQGDYASAAAGAFVPRQVRGDPATVLAEAGTGTGKTLGYVAPASLWAERNGAPVWISTYTRHLQRQVETELARLHPDPAERRRRVVVRKGRENYLCLLNLEDRVNGLAGASGSTGVIPLALIARWALATADGDLAGGDLPGWFGEVFGPAALFGLADRRGECIHGACPHYKRCYVEHTIRRARTAELVVANHALVMIQAAHGFTDGTGSGGLDGGAVPTRYVFDEGHHVFDAADSAFAAVFSGIEGANCAAGCWGGGRPVARPRPAAAAGRTGRRAAGTGSAAGRRPASRPRAARPGLVIRLSEETPELGGLEAGQANVAELLLHWSASRCSRARPCRSWRPPSAAGPTWNATCTRNCRAWTRRRSGSNARWGGSRNRCARWCSALNERLDAEADELEPATRARIEAAARVLKHRAVERLARGRRCCSNWPSRPTNPVTGRRTSPSSGWTGGRQGTATPACTATGWTRRCRSPPPWRQTRTAC